MQGLPPAALSRALAALALCCCLAAGGCGKSDDHKFKPLVRPANLPANYSLQLFNCKDWTHADQRVREYVVASLTQAAHDQVTGTGISGRGAVLKKEEAFGFFQSRCADPRARGFVLYKLYAYAAGFRGGAPGG